MELTADRKNNLIICNHPIAEHNLSLLRDKNTPSELFRNATKRISQILFHLASENLPLSPQHIETPIEPISSNFIDTEAEIIISPILRAGLIFSQTVSEILPNARVHHIGLFRDEKTLKPVAYYNNLPGKFKNPDKTFVYILDPMLATGGSAIAAIKLFTALDIAEKNIRFICFIAAPEGIKKLQGESPNITIVSACVDKNLNSSGYIVPGLGDAGDRTFNTIY